MELVTVLDGEDVGIEVMDAESDEAAADEGTELETKVVGANEEASEVVELGYEAAEVEEGEDSEVVPKSEVVGSEAAAVGGVELDSESVVVNEDVAISAAEEVELDALLVEIDREEVSAVEDGLMLISEVVELLGTAVEDDVASPLRVVEVGEDDPR